MAIFAVMPDGKRLPICPTCAFSEKVRRLEQDGAPHCDGATCSLCGVELPATRPISVLEPIDPT